MNSSAEAGRYANKLPYKTRIYQALCTQRIRALDALLYDLFHACHDNQFGIYKSDPVRYLDTYNPEQPDQYALIESIFEILCQIHDEFHMYPEVINSFKHYRKVSPYMLREGESYDPEESVRKDTILKISLALHTTQEQRVRSTNAFIPEPEATVPKESVYEEEPYYEEEVQELYYQATGTDGMYLDAVAKEPQNNYEVIEDQGGHDDFIQSAPEAYLQENSARFANAGGTPIADTGFHEFARPMGHEPDFQTESVDYFDERDFFDPNKPIAEQLMAERDQFESDFGALKAHKKQEPRIEVKEAGFGEKIIAKIMPKPKAPLVREEPEMHDVLMNSSLGGLSVSRDITMDNLLGISVQEEEIKIPSKRSSSARMDQIYASHETEEIHQHRSKWFGDLESRTNNTEKGYYGYVKLFGLFAIKKDIYVDTRDNISKSEAQIHPWVRSLSTVTWLTQDGTMVAYY